MKKYRLQHPDDRLLFPNTKGGPDTHFLRALKKTALKAGLNCGHCYNKNGECCKAAPVCKHFELHKFRKTFAFFHHTQGVPVRVLMEWLGHSDLETTLQYLQVSEVHSEKTRNLVNNTYKNFACAV